MTCERCQDAAAVVLLVIEGMCEVRFLGVCKPCALKTLEDPGWHVDAVLSMPGEDGGWSQEWTPAEYRTREGAA